MENIEPPGLLDRATQVHPFTQLPIIEAAGGPVGAGLGGNELASHVCSVTPEHRRLMAKSLEFAGKKPCP